MTIQRRPNPQLIEPCLTAPPMGGPSFPATTRVEDIADWIFEEDKLPLLFALSLYTQIIQEYDGFVLKGQTSSGRVGVWFREITGEWVVGCRGTDIFGNGGSDDLKDDSKIAFGNYCDLTLIAETRPWIDFILQQDFDLDEIMVVGHSLGGAAAMCLGQQYGIRCISLNGGASPTNPVIAGAGPNLATHYHVFGDLISSHMSPSAAKVIRVMGDKTEFGTFYSHAAVRILKSDGPKKIVSAEQEDQAYLRWASQFKLGWKIFNPVFTLGVYLAHLKRQDIAKKSPIPGSARWHIKLVNKELK